jgi:hypothetical protein
MAMTDEKITGAEKMLSQVQSWAVIHTVATVLLIVWNYVANAGLIFERSVADVSDQWSTSFTPADYAFSIWGVIYLALLALCGYEIKLAFFTKPRTEVSRAWILKLGPYFLVAQVACGLWLLAWLSGAILVSLVLMTLLLAMLGTLIVRLSAERTNSTWQTVAFIWWPLSLYSGWITVAFLANLSSYLRSLNWNVVLEPGWAIALAAILTLHNLAMIFWRNMHEYALVAVWALVALFVRFSGSDNYSAVGVVALAAAIVIAASAAIHLWTTMTWHRTT